MSHRQNKNEKKAHDLGSSPSKEKFGERIQKLRSRRKKMIQKMTIPERIQNIRTHMGLTSSTSPEKNV